MRMNVNLKGIAAVLIILITTLLISGCGGAITTETGALTQSRWLHSAFLLQDGKVLIFGGQETPSRASSKAEVYDPSTGTWAATGSMGTERGQGHTAVMLQDGRVLVAGSSESEDGSTEIYDPSTSTWTSAGYMSSTRLWASSTVLKDGRVLVSGGEDVSRNELDSVDIYDSSTGQWTPASSMLESHVGHVSITLDSGKVLLVGEFKSELYDPSTDTWSETAPTNRERALGANILRLSDGKVMVTGGEIQPKAWSIKNQAHPTVKVEVYDPSTGTWAIIGDMTEALKLHSTLIAADGSIIVVGATLIDEYDVATGLWTPAGELQFPRMEGHTATLLQNGTILIVGGKVVNEEDGRTTSIEQVELYDPAALAE